MHQPTLYQELYLSSAEYTQPSVWQWRNEHAEVLAVVFILNVAALCRFLAGSDSDTDSDEDRRVVLKSAKDKRFSELSSTCDEIRVRT